MRRLKGLRKRKPTFTVAKWPVRFYGLSLLPANQVEVAFVEDVVSDMPDDERFRKFAVVENQRRGPLPKLLWADLFSFIFACCDVCTRSLCHNK